MGNLHLDWQNADDEFESAINRYRERLLAINAEHGIRDMALEERGVLSAWVLVTAETLFTDQGSNNTLVYHSPERQPKWQDRGLLYTGLDLVDEPEED